MRVTAQEFKQIVYDGLLLEGTLVDYENAFKAVDRSGNGTIGAQGAALSGPSAHARTSERLCSTLLTTGLPRVSRLQAPRSWASCSPRWATP